MESWKKIISNFNSTGQIIFGSPAKFSIEHRFLNASLLLGAMTGLASFIFNIVLDLGLLLIFLTGITVLICLILYYYTRFQRFFKFPLYFFSIVLLMLLSMLWLANAGSDGPVTYIYFAVLAFFIFVYDGYSRLIMISLLILNLITLSFLESKFPELVSPYTNSSIRAIDHFSVLIPTILIIYFIVSYTRNHLQEEKRKAEVSDHLKTAFLANMSHEIRTPMNSILGFTQLLDDENISPEEKKQYLGYIQSSGATLMNLINDIIDISKIEAGELKIKRSYIWLPELFKELQSTFEAEKIKLDKDQIKLNLELPIYAESYRYNTDPFRLKQVLSNLLSNAFKYTNGGTIEFGFKEISNRLLFFVRDTGIGMTDEQSRYIFERFRKIEDHDDRLYSGTGLGLTISRHLVELLGGELKVESRLNIGTEFSFSIALIKGKFIVPKEKEGVTRMEYLWNGVNFLIVEDDPTNYEYIREVLLPTNAIVTWVKNGREALMSAGVQHFDLVLLDIKLPVMDGIETLKNLKHSFPDLPVIAVTAYAMAESKDKYLNMGFDGYLSKPVGRYQLLEEIDNFLKGSN